MDGSYQFSLLDRYEFNDGTVISLWSSEDMIALKLISQALGLRMKDVISEFCYHVKGHGGLKKAVVHTHEALKEYTYVFRSDIKSFYASIHFDVLMSIIQRVVQEPVLLGLVHKALRRTETWGGLFYNYEEKSLPLGSPLSPLLGAIVLLPLAQAMENIKDIFFCLYMDDWVILARTKTALRKVVKLTHKIVNSLKLELHPTKTYIGKISHGFNFLGYYFDDHKLLPSRESVKRLQERAVALYEQPLNSRKYHRHKNAERDISEYQANEASPSNEEFKTLLTTLLTKASQNPDIYKKLRRYLGQWCRWLKCGLYAIDAFLISIKTHMPFLYALYPCSPGTLSSGSIA